MNPNTQQEVSLTVDRIRVWPCFSSQDAGGPAFYIAEARIAETGGREYGLGMTAAKAVEICRGDCRARGIELFPFDVEALDGWPEGEGLRVIHAEHWNESPHPADPQKRPTVAYKARLTSGAVLTVKGLLGHREAQGAIVGLIAQAGKYKTAGHYFVGHEYDPAPSADGPTEL